MPFGEGNGKAALTDDRFLGGRLNILQPEKGFRAGIDSVLLAAAVPADPGDLVFEAGIGTGVAALCLASRVDAVRITGVETSARYALIAEENIRRNGMDGRIKLIRGDIADGLRRDLSNWPEQGTFAHAFANPPFHLEDAIQPSPDPHKAQAHAFRAEDLETWIRVISAMVRPRGTVTVIYKPDMLGELLHALGERFGHVRVLPIHPREREPASRIIVQAVRASKAPLEILPGLVLHDDGHGFRPDVDAILRDGKALALG